MHRGMGLLAVVMTSAVLAGCNGALMPQGEWSGLVHPDVLAKAGLKYYWTARVPLLVGERVRSIYRLDEKVYCLTTSNRLLAVDAMTGDYKWAFEVAEPGETVFRPVNFDNVALTPNTSGIGEILSPRRLPSVTPVPAVMLNTLTGVVVINRTTGEAIRRPGNIVLQDADVANTAGTTDGYNYYVAAPNGQYYAVRLQEGVKVWSMFTSSEPIMAPLVFNNGHLYITNEGGGVYCTAVGRKGRQEWNHRLDGPVVGGIYVDDRGCFIPCMDHRIYAYNPLTGEKLWDPFICDGQLQQAIQVGENSVFQYADQDKFYCLDVATGRLRWPAIRDGRMVLSVIGGNLYVRDGRNNLLVLDEMLGSRKMSVPMTGHEMFVGNATAPVMYSGRADGRLFCIAPATLSHLTMDVLKGKKK